MIKRLRHGRLGTVIVLVSAAVLSFTVTASAQQAVPPSRLAVQPSPRPQPPEPQVVLIGRGPEEAANVLLMSRRVLPFSPHLPTAIPSGYELSQVEARAARADLAMIDVSYLAGGNAQIQLFESSYPNNKSVTAPVLQRDNLVIADTTWQYLLLSFGQPDGSSVLIHFAERPFDGHTYESVALHSRGEMSREKAALVTLLNSIR